MATEIERRFLVSLPIAEKIVNESSVTPTRIVQGYLDCRGATVRVRIENNDKGYLVIKGPKVGMSCPEFDYEIPKEDAIEMFGLTIGSHVIKDRYDIIHQDHVWELDIFKGHNLGLAIAEIELSSEEEYFQRPTWLGMEITTDANYSNYSLAIKPFLSRK